MGKEEYLLIENALYAGFLGVENCLFDDKIHAFACSEINKSCFLT